MSVKDIIETVHSLLHAWLLLHFTPTKAILAGDFTLCSNIRKRFSQSCMQVLVLGIRIIVKISMIIGRFFFSNIFYGLSSRKRLELTQALVSAHTAKNPEI